MAFFSSTRKWACSLVVLCLAASLTDSASAAASIRRLLILTSQPQSEALCYRQVGPYCTQYFPSYPKQACEDWASTSKLGEQFVPWEQGCIWPVDTPCSYFDLSNTTVGLQTVELEYFSAAGGSGLNLPLCDSNFTAQIKAAVESGKLDAPASTLPRSLWTSRCCMPGWSTLSSTGFQLCLMLQARSKQPRRSALQAGSAW